MKGPTYPMCLIRAIEAEERENGVEAVFQNKSAQDLPELEDATS